MKILSRSPRRMSYALGVSLLAVISTGAQSSVNNMGDVTAMGFGGSYVGSGTYSDDYNFTLSAPTSLAGAHTNLSFFYSGLGNTYSLYDAIGGTLLSSYTLPGPGSTIRKEYAPGSYRLNVAGGQVNTPGGYQFHVAPIPEPSTLALMLGGIGLLGWMYGRKNKTSDKDEAMHA